MTARVCPVPGCPELTEGGRCLVHSTTRDPRSSRNHRGVSRHLRGHGARYDRARRELAGEPCALQLPGCTGVATSADYTVPGDWTSTLQPACLHCQRAQGAALTRSMP